MSSRSQVFLSDATWTCPTGVSLVRVVMEGAGGAGGAWAKNFAGASMGGGGAGEICVNFPVPVTPGTAYLVSVGAGGSGGLHPTGNININDASAGSPVSFNGLSMLGGGVGGLNGVAGGGAGGGPNGFASTINQAGDRGSAESPVHYGGAGGGSGKFNGGQQIGEYLYGSAGTPSTFNAGGGGAASIYGAGGRGGDGDGTVANGAGQSATGYSSGGGGSSHEVGGLGSSSSLRGGDGANGIVILFWTA